MSKKHTQETKDKISKSLKLYHSSGIKSIKKKFKKSGKRVWKEIKND